MTDLQLSSQQGNPFAMIANKAAKAEENKKNEIVAYLAHDIRTPLTSIIGYLNLLDEIPDMDAAVVEAVLAHRRGVQVDEDGQTVFSA